MTGSTNQGDTVSVVVIVQHSMISDSLRCALDMAPGIDVVAVASDAHAATRIVQEHRPDVIVLDCQLPHGQALLQLPNILGAHHATKVLMIGAPSDTHAALRSLEA
ncbi:MAG TPA: response regulator, partial [Ilumatobacteraceae bacterium]